MNCKKPKQIYWNITYFQTFHINIMSLLFVEIIGNRFTKLKSIEADFLVFRKLGMPKKSTEFGPQAASWGTLV